MLILIILATMNLQNAETLKHDVDHNRNGITAFH